MIWKLAFTASVGLNVFVAICLWGAVHYEQDLREELARKDRRIGELESRPEAITTLTPEQFATFMEIARTESSSDALPHWK